MVEDPPIRRTPSLELQAVCLQRGVARWWLRCQDPLAMERQVHLLLFIFSSGIGSTSASGPRSSPPQVVSPVWLWSHLPPAKGLASNLSFSSWVSVQPRLGANLEMFHSFSNIFLESWNFKLTQSVASCNWIVLLDGKVNFRWKSRIDYESHEAFDKVCHSKK